jgi:type IV secretory pathway VirB2 component (pilin)
MQHEHTVLLWSLRQGRRLKDFCSRSGGLARFLFLMILSATAYAQSDPRSAVGSIDDLAIRFVGIPIADTLTLGTILIVLLLIVSFAPERRPYIRVALQCLLFAAKEWIGKNLRVVRRSRSFLPIVVSLLLAGSAYGQSDPWSTVATRLATAFTGPIARGFALVAIVIGGLELATDTGGRRMMGGLIFGCGMALLATQFLTWLFS